MTKQGSDKDSGLAEIIEEGEIAVYLPMSNQASSYMLVAQARK